MNGNMAKLQANISSNLVSETRELLPLSSELEPQRTNKPQVNTMNRDICTTSVRNRLRIYNSRIEILDKKAIWRLQMNSGSGNGFCRPTLAYSDSFRPSLAKS